MDYREFSAKVKAKYPQYANVDDRELAQKVTAKYPQYQGITFDDTPTPEPEGRSLWETLSIPAEKSRDGYQMLQDLIPADVQTPTNIPGIGMANAKQAMGVVKEVAPGFISPESIALGGAGMALKASGPLVRGGGKTLAQMGKLLSGNQAKDVEALFQRPKAFFGKTMGGAQNVYGKAVESAGGSGMAPNQEAFETAAKTARKLLIKSKDAPLSPLEALEGRQALDEIMGSTRIARKLNRLQKIRDGFDEVVKADPSLANADAVYRDAKLAEKFRKVFPVNKDGGASVARTALAGALSGVLGSGIPTILSSPAVVGGLTAGMGFANKAVGPVIRSASRAAPRAGQIYGAMGFRKKERN